MRYLLPFLLVATLQAAELKPSGPSELRQPQLAVGHGRIALAYGAGSAIWLWTVTLNFSLKPLIIASADAITGDSANSVALSSVIAGLTARLW